MLRLLVVCLFLLLWSSAALCHAASSSVGTGRIHELTFTSSGSYADPYNDVDLDVVFTAPTGETLRVPGFWAGGVTLQALEPGVRYRARYYDPVTGTDIPLGAVTPDAEGAWTPPLPPEVHDWVLVAEVVAP